LDYPLAAENLSTTHLKPSRVMEAGAGLEVQVRMVQIGDLQSASLQHSDDAPAECAEQLGQFRVGRSPGAVKGWPTAAERVGSIEEQHVQVNIERQPR
jgi:hypothetical protein